MSTGLSRTAVRTVLGPATAALLGLVVLSACQEDGGAGEDEPTPSQDAGGLTAPGSVLEAGEPATVTRSAGTGTVQVKVLGIEEGERADLQAIGYEQADEVTPYYLQVEVTPVSGVTPFQLDDYLRVWGDDEPLDHLTVIRDYAPCQEALVADDGTLGQAREHCVVYVRADDDPEPDHVYFDNDDTYDTYDDTAIEWTLLSPGPT